MEAAAARVSVRIADFLVRAQMATKGTAFFSLRLLSHEWSFNAVEWHQFFLVRQLSVFAYTFLFNGTSNKPLFIGLMV